MGAASVDRVAASSRRRMLPFVALAAGLVVVLALAMYLYDHSRRDVIASGVTIDGVSVGGMHASAARTKLQRELLARLAQPVTVRSGSETWVLGPREAAVRVDVANMVDQAVNASREGSILSRTFRGLFGEGISRRIPLIVSYSHRAARGLCG